MNRFFNYGGNHFEVEECVHNGIVCVRVYGLDVQIIVEKPLELVDNLNGFVVYAMQCMGCDIDDDAVIM